MTWALTVMGPCGVQAYNPEGYQELKEFTDEHPNGLKDGDLFCANLMRVSPRHRQLGRCPACPAQTLRLW